VLLVTIPGTNEQVEAGAGASLARAVSAGCPTGGINDGYRSYLDQVVMFKSRYTVRWIGDGPYGDVRWWGGVRYVRTSGLGMAAIPGTSTHGDGLAIDFAYQQRTWLRAHGTAYGWFNTIRSEPWHWEYRARNDTHKGDDDMSVDDVRIGLGQMFEEAAARSTPTGRALADRITNVIWGYKNTNVATGDKDAYFHLLNPSVDAPAVNVKALAAEIAKLIPAPTVDYAALAEAVNNDAAKRMQA